MLVELETILYEEEDDIAYICINMPPANKMIGKFLEEIVTVINKYARITTAKGIIVYGKGRHFSSGADIEQLLNIISNGTILEGDKIVSYPDWYVECKKSFCFLYNCEIPVISLIRGFCIGSGFELALATHIRICERGSRVGLPEATFGLLPGVNGTLRVCEEIGLMNAFEFVLRGELITEEDALNKGLVECVVEKKESLVYAKYFIKYIANKNIKYNVWNAKEIFHQFFDYLHMRE
jgi:enoyl-CoA hydratase